MFFSTWLSVQSSLIFSKIFSSRLFDRLGFFFWVWSEFWWFLRVLCRTWRSGVESATRRGVNPLALERHNFWSVAEGPKIGFEGDKATRAVTRVNFPTLRNDHVSEGCQGLSYSHARFKTHQLFYLSHILFLKFEWIRSLRFEKCSRFSSFENQSLFSSCKKY